MEEKALNQLYSAFINNDYTQNDFEARKETLLKAISEAKLFNTDPETRTLNDLLSLIITLRDIADDFEDEIRDDQFS